MMKTTMKISGMHCAGCSSNLQRALSRQKGVHSANVDLESATAQVEYDEAVIDLDGLKQAVESVGFDVVG